MLKTITWEDFIGAMLPVLITYYLVIILKYYRHELVAIFSGRREPGKGEVSSAGGAPAATEKPSEQGDLFVGKEPGVIGMEGMTSYAGQEGSGEMFKVMEQVVSLLKGIVSGGVTEGIDKEDLLMQIEDTLSRYHQLKDTPYQGAINSFLARTCSSNFSLLLEDADLMALWG